MMTTNGIMASCILAIISAADQHEEMRCKARPGCHLAKCDPGLTFPGLNANEYPITCVRSSVQDVEEYMDLKRDVQVLQAEMEAQKTQFSKSVEALSKEMEALKIQLLKPDQSNEALSKELNALMIKTNDSESRLAKPNTALQMITRSSCDGAQLESALARNDSGGVFKLDIPEVGIKNVFCDVTDDGGNWTVFQRRMNGNVDFYRNWDDYVKGFGDLQGDHWLGLETLYEMTEGQNSELKIEMITRKGIHWVAKYRHFQVGPGWDKYKLRASGFSGNASDSLKYHSSGRQFSAKDADNSGARYNNCPSDLEGGWWYSKYDNCGYSNLNGNFHKRSHRKGFWWGRINFPLRFSEMKFRKWS